MRIFISTGEVSGDLQGAMLVESLYRQAEAKGIEIEILALGGDRMAAAGAKVLENTATISSIGLIEALPLILPTLKIQRRVKRYLQDSPPDLMVLIDYMGANIVIGNYIRKHFPSIPIIYYIAPQAWVWSPLEKTTQQLVAIMDLLLAIFPEEARFFAKKGVSVKWVGHPLLDRMQHAPSREHARQDLGIEPEQIAIALLPASRFQEIKYLLPVICQAAQKLQEKLPQVHFWIPVSLDIYRSSIEAIISEYGLRATLLEGRALEAIAAADLAIAKSGTANLEIALLNVPQVALYRGSPVTMWIARTFLNFNVLYVSPPNLIVNRLIIPELIQEAVTAERIFQESLELLLNRESRQHTLDGYQEMRALVGEIGVCDRAAAEILQFAR